MTFNRLKDQIKDAFYDFVQNDHPDILAAFIKNSKDTQAINELAFHEKPVVRLQVAESELLTEESLFSLLNDPSDVVKRHAIISKASTPNTRHFIIQQKLEPYHFYRNNPTLAPEDIKNMPMSCIPAVVNNQCLNEESLLLIIPFLNNASFEVVSSYLNHTNITAKILHVIFDTNVDKIIKLSFLDNLIRHPKADKSLLLKCLMTEPDTESQIARAKRRGDILRLMKKYGFINKQELDRLVKNLQAKDSIV